jgi:hypothetical protein
MTDRLPALFDHRHERALYNVALFTRQDAQSHARPKERVAGVFNAAVAPARYHPARGFHNLKKTLLGFGFQLF